MKKKFIVMIVFALVITSFFVGVVAAETLAEKRADIYRHFGPKLIDAVVQVMQDEINILRTDAGLPERTGEQVVDAIQSQLDSIENYEWMDEEFP